MKELEIKSTVKIYESFEELENPEDILLCEKSIEARKNSYSPYSDFQVGSAVMLDNGKIVLGSNQENAVFPIGLCAERVAMFSAHNIYLDVKIIKLALSTSAKESCNDFPVFPCGSCRHAIIEEESKWNSNVKLFIVAYDKRVFVLESVKDILPFAFRKDSL